MENGAAPAIDKEEKPRILLVAPTPPPYGGMALQARLLERLLRADGVPVVFAPSNFSFPRGLAWLDVPLMRTLVRALLIWGKLWRQASQVDVVHVLAASWWYFFLVVYPAVMVGRLRGKRVVLNYRGGEARVFFARYGWLAAPVFRLANAITVPSQFLAGIIQERFSVPVQIVSNILDTSAFCYRRRATLQPKLLVTRHLEEIYDVESVLRAFREVQQDFPEASLWIAGTGSQKERLQDLATAWGLRNVRFLGHVAHGDLPAIYDQCDLYVNASKVDNFPGALLEASAAGLVVISTSAGGIGFIYDDGKTAFLVEPGDWRNLAGAVVRALRDRQGALEMTARGVELARGCEWKEVRKSLLRAYDSSAPQPGDQVAGEVRGIEPGVR